jgi:hypothetical protein
MVKGMFKRNLFNFYKIYKFSGIKVLERDNLFIMITIQRVQTMVIQGTLVVYSSIDDF